MWAYLFRSYYSTQYTAKALHDMNVLINLKFCVPKSASTSIHAVAWVEGAMLGTLGVLWMNPYSVVWQKVSDKNTSGCPGAEPGERSQHRDRRSQKVSYPVQGSGKASWSGQAPKARSDFKGQDWKSECWDHSLLPHPNPPPWDSEKPSFTIPVFTDLLSVSA